MWPTVYKALKLEFGFAHIDAVRLWNYSQFWNTAIQPQTDHTHHVGMQFMRYQTYVSCQDLICGWRLKFWLAFALTWPFVAGSYALCIWQLKLAYLCLMLTFHRHFWLYNSFTTRLGKIYFHIVHVRIHAMNRTRHHRFGFSQQKLNFLRPRFVCLRTALNEPYHSIWYSQNSLSYCLLPLLLSPKAKK